MKVLKFNKDLCALVGIHQSDRFKAPYKRLVELFSFYFFLINLGSYFLASAAYIHENIHNFSKIFGATVACISAISCVGNAGSYISFVINKNQLEDLRKELQEIVDSGEYEAINSFFFILFDFLDVFA